MGYLLKEALKTLCGVNQWSYAVFWKFGCQNPELLIWEDCYYERSLPENFPWFSVVENGCFRARDNVHLLVDNMMMDSRVVILGERLVGRVAFTGSHQWILSENYNQEAHPPEVLKELRRQFSAGMKTIAVIPVLPHGVVQFGSFLTIMESSGFVNNVASSIVELDLFAGVFPSEEYAAKEQSLKVRIENPLFESSDYIRYAGQGVAVDAETSFPFVEEIQKKNVAAFQEFNVAPALANSGFTNGMAKAEVITSTSENSTKIRNGSLYGSAYGLNDRTISNTKPIGDGNIRPNSSERKNATFTQREAAISNSVDLFAADSFLSECNDAYVEPRWGDDLFDVLGPDFKNQLFRTRSKHLSIDDDISKTSRWDTRISTGKKTLEFCSADRGNSESGIFSSETDNLLDAMVARVCSSANPSMEDSLSCKTTLTSMSGNTSIPFYDQSDASAVVNGELLGVPKYFAKSGASNIDSSIYGSQISSWIEKEKQNNSVSSCQSTKKSNETSKPGRKRLKPGENPRPRPKDRQMIQDRVKELREIVPNGAKCSIDSLLERTIKHMLFLQSVMKHADKLKQTGESEVTSKDGGVTWAYEVGAQSMVCPIRVEDLNQPRQMLVEMLCEESGLFLEIADVVRGLGLTILKGIMETRNDKIWSRFTVEANRDITRMEVFVSLVHLLEQSAKSGDESLMSQQLYVPGISSSVTDPI
ncbi:transcription factor LHW-like isoform X2 [Andrographis paniculata]|uniref:transcription factor LHW-like isoform X2 n=1 Tax=Andrographis paniculata TaxID=175694 RepID=UPI0021E79851|nr:transcription factor LHW-like isoform X2 [Andrographis paniculata]